MKTGLSLSELAAELERQSNAKRDFVVDTRQVTMMTGGDEDPRTELHLPLGAGEFEVVQGVHRQIGSHLKIPANYYDMLRAGHRGLLDHSVNTLLREAPSRRMLRCFDFGEDGPRTARAFLSDRYRRLDNDDLARAALEIAGEIPDVIVPTSQITDSHMYITILAPRVTGEVQVGDQVQAGIRITNSETGHGALKVEPIVYRLICLNGMTVTRATRKYHIGRQIDSDDALTVLSEETLVKDDAAFFSKLRDVMRAAVNETQFNLVVGQLRDAAAGVRIEQPIQAMEELQRRFSFGDGEKESVLKHLIEGGDLSAYGALNAVTRAAQDVESYDRSMELELVGGKILELAGSGEWETIARS